MRALLVVLLLGCVSPLAGQTTARLQTGTVSLPADYCVQSFRGTDSAPGVIQRCDSSFVIHYDIGGMAGAHVHPSRRGEYLWMIEHDAGGLRALTALFEEDGRRRIAMTLYGDDREWGTLPANFFADVRDERDVAEFLLVAGSYRPRAREADRR